MVALTRMEKVRSLLAEMGPSTTPEVAARLGITNMNTASSLMSHAQAYGYIRIVKKVPVRPDLRGGCRYVWGVRDKQAEARA